MRFTLDGKNGLSRNDLRPMHTIKVIMNKRIEKKKVDSSSVFLSIVFNSSTPSDFFDVFILPKDSNEVVEVEVIMDIFCLL